MKSITENTRLLSLRDYLPPLGIVLTLDYVIEYSV